MMATFTISTDQKIIRDHIRPALVLIHDTLERAIPIVLDSIKQQDLPVSPYLFSTNIRCHLKKALLGGGYNPEDPDDLVPLTVHNISNDGLDFDCLGLRIKVLKGPVLPKAASDSRGTFYQQSFAFFKEDFPDAPLRNLVVLWEYDPTSKTLALRLVAPKNKQAESYWAQQVPTPAEWITPTNLLNIEDEDLEVAAKPLKSSQGKKSG